MFQNEKWPRKILDKNIKGRNTVCRNWKTPILYWIGVFYK